MYDDPVIGGMYIGTQDLNFSKKSSQEAKIFKSYDILKSSLSERFEEDLNKNIEGTMRLDIFSRILHLTDLNQGNFGCVIIKDKLEKTWKIVDFRPPVYQSYRYTNIVDGFLASNGTQNYDINFHRVLLSQPIELRLQIALNILNNADETFSLDSIREVLEQIKLFVANNESYLNIIDKNIAMRDLANYADAISQNFAQFKKEISDKIVELKGKASFSI